jgi:hypothetical protein
VVWDDDPLSVGATPLQVYVDGVAQLEPIKVKKSMGVTFTDPIVKPSVEEPKMRVKIETTQRDAVCSRSKAPKSRFVITGIKKTFLDNWPKPPPQLVENNMHNLTLVVSDGSVSCFDVDCGDSIASLGGDAVRVDLANGHLLPGLTAMTTSLGMVEIATDPVTGDGYVNPMLNAKDPANVDYAKYGVMLKGKAFARARMGGVTRAISPPILLAGFLQGVSVGILTGQDKTLLDGGIFQEEVALHVHVDNNAKVTEYSTISGIIKTLREMITSGQGKYNETVYGRAATGQLPLIIHANNQVRIVPILSGFSPERLILSASYR